GPRVSASVRPRQEGIMVVRTLTAAAALLGVGMWLFVQAASAWSQDAKTGRAPDAAVVYKIVQQGVADPVWRVTITGKGFAGAAKPVRLHLENWGEWQDEDGYYLRELTAKPAIRR